jgi:DNA polymerase I
MGSKPKRIYVKKMKGCKYPPTDVLSFEFADQIPPEFVIDYELMLNKTLRDPIIRMVESLGWTWESIDPTMSTLEMFGIT